MKPPPRLLPTAPTRALLLALPWAAACSVGLQATDLGKDTQAESDGSDGQGDASGDGGGPPDTGWSGSDGAGDGGSSGDGSTSGGSSGGGSTSGGATSGGTGGGDGADGATEIDIAVDLATPDYGINAGGDRVRVSGGPFDASAVVTFGAEPATVVSWSATELEVETPPIARVGRVQVAVTTDAGSGARAGAFTYWPDGRGLAGLIGVMEWGQLVGSYWGGSTFSSGTAAIYFLDPASTAWWMNFAPSLDSCAHESFSPAGLFVDSPVASQVELRSSSGRSVPLEWDATANGYIDDELTSAQWGTGERYALVPIPSDRVPEVGVPDVVMLPSTLNVTNPAITGSSPDTFTRGESINWSPGGNDWVLLRLILDNGYGTSGQETVFCVARDDGSFVPDTSLFSVWAVGAQLTIHVSAARDSSGGQLPWNQSTSKVAGLNTVIGAVFTR